MNLLAEKGIVRGGSGNERGKGIVRTGSRNKKRKRNFKSWYWKTMGFLIRPHPLTNFEIQKYKNEPRCNGVFLRNNLPKKN